jgi:hypothetical protein
MVLGNGEEGQPEFENKDNMVIDKNKTNKQN